jgi:hypothetical protein
VTVVEKYVTEVVVSNKLELAVKVEVVVVIMPVALVLVV